MSSDDKLTFDRFSKLPAPLITTSMQVMKFAGDYVEITADAKFFDWTKFTNAVKAYKGDDLSFDKFKSTTIAESTATVQVICDRIVQFLAEALSVVITAEDITALLATIKATFTGLKEAKDSGFADFSKSSSSSNTSWEYRIQFAFPNPDTPDFFYSLVTTIKLEADISEESSWWGLVSSSSHSFSATIDAMQLVVMKGFRNPDQN